MILEIKNLKMDFIQYAIGTTIFILLYNKVFLVTFDESFAIATGLDANFYNTLLAIITPLV